MDRTGWNWLVTLVLAAAVIAVVFGIFLLRIQRWMGCGMGL